MRVLVYSGPQDKLPLIYSTNDDGPPGEASPYILPFVAALQKHTDWKITVVIPKDQKSWIGKAFVIGDTITTSYYRPDAASESERTQTGDRPPEKGDWFILDGTPATCTNIAINYIADEPVDLVISGPNFGRNTSAIFALGSGTIGGALEGCVLGVPSIALSYAFTKRDTEHEIVAQASELAIRIINHLKTDWHETDADLFSINIPLIDSLSKAPIHYTKILPNRWRSGFVPIESEQENSIESELSIRTQDLTNGDTPVSSHGTKYRFKPMFSQIVSSIERMGQDGGIDDGRMSDGWAVKEGIVSVTPLKANFMHSEGPKLKGEIKL